MSAAAPESPSELIRAHRACEAFEAAWQAGERPRVEEFCPGPDRVVVAELIGLDAYYRRRAGETPRADDYLGRFPGLGPDDLARLLDEHPPARPAPAAGGQLGRFTLLERVGAGACGAVWRAYDTALGRPVALKLPHPAVVAAPDALERFRREARVAARLRHPGIVTVHEVADVDGLPVLVEEFVAGESLRDFLARARPAPREAAALAADLAEALDYAHRHGAVHRDVKPGNVVVAAAGGRPVLVDFGLAADGPGSTLTVSGELVGTPAYMSPEQARGDAREADARTDVYSLGVVLYEMLTGGPPFRGTRAMVLRQVAEDDPRPPRRVNERVPRDLETVCLKAMAKEPARRYRTAAEFAADLRRFLAGEAVLARPVGRVERAVRWARRKPTAAALLGVSVAAAAALAAGGVWHSARLAAANAGLAAANTDLAAAADRERAAAAEARARGEAGRRSLYAMTLSELPGLARRDPVRVRAILHDPAACPPDLRDFTWRYFDRLCRYEDGELPHAAGGVSAMAATPDSAYLVSATYADEVVVWDWPGKKLVARTKNPGHVLTIAALPGGRFATAGEGGTIRIRKLATAAVECELSGHAGSVTALAWAYGCDRLVSGGDDGTVRVWDVAARKEAARWDAGVGAVTTVAESGGRLAVGGKAKPAHIRLFRLPGGEPLASWPVSIGAASSLAFSPDGRLLAEGNFSGEAYLRDADTGRVMHQFNGNSWMAQTVRFSPDGRVLAAGGWDGNLRFWDAATGALRTNLAKHRVLCLAFGPDGRVAAASHKRPLVDLWRLPADPEPAPRFPLDGTTVTALSAAPGRVAAGSVDGDVRLWPTADGGGKPAGMRQPSSIYAMAHSPDGRSLVVATSSFEVRVRDPDTGGTRFALKGSEGLTYDAAFSLDGGLLATACRDGTVRVWRLADRQAVTVLRGHEGAVRAVAFAPDGKTLASGGEDGTVRLWDAAAWTLLGVVGTHDDWALSVAFSPDGKSLATGGKDRAVRVWDVAGRRERFRAVGYTNWVSAVRYSPDGTTLVTATGAPLLRSAGELKLLDPETGFVRAVLEGRGAPVAFTPDGKTLLVSAPGGVAELLAAE